MRCTVQTLVVGMLKDLPEYGKSMRGEMKALLREIKRNPQETNSEGKDTRTQINDLEEKEEINIQPEQNEETRIQNNEEKLRKLWDNFKPTQHPNHRGARRRRGRAGH